MGTTSTSQHNFSGARRETSASKLAQQQFTTKMQAKRQTKQAKGLSYATRSYTTERCGLREIPPAPPVQTQPVPTSETATNRRDMMKGWTAGNKIIRCTQSNTKSCDKRCFTFCSAVSHRKLKSIQCLCEIKTETSLSASSYQIDTQLYATNI